MLLVMTDNMLSLPMIIIT